MYLITNKIEAELLKDCIEDAFTLVFYTKDKTKAHNYELHVDERRVKNKIFYDRYVINELIVNPLCHSCVGYVNDRNPIGYDHIPLNLIKSILVSIKQNVNYEIYINNVGIVQLENYFIFENISNQYSNDCDIKLNKNCWFSIDHAVKLLDKIIDEANTVYSYYLAEGYQEEYNKYIQKAVCNIIDLYDLKLDFNLLN